MNDMYNDPRTLTEHWLLAEFEGQDLSERADQKLREHECVGGLWPFLNDYFSPYNPVFSPLFTSYLKTHCEEQIWLRDGLVPLTWFLRQNRPEEIAGTLLVSERLAPFVPEEWRQKISLYRLHAQEVRKPDTLLIAGPVTERICGLDEVESLLDQALEVLGKRQMSVKLFCPIRGEGEKFPAEFFCRVFSRFPNAEVIDWHSLVNAGRFENTVFLELNGDWIYADSFVQQHVLSRGAGLLFNKAESKNNRLLPLSRFHSAEILPLGKVKSAKWDEAVFKYCRQMAEVNESVRDNGLWPSWYESGCHALK